MNGPMNLPNIIHDLKFIKMIQHGHFEYVKYDFFSRIGACLSGVFTIVLVRSFLGTAARLAVQSILRRRLTPS